MKLEWRTNPSFVNSVISMVARSTGSTHVAPRRYSRGGGGSNGTSIGTQRLQAGAEVLEGSLREPGADAAGEHELVAVEAPDEQCAERRRPVTGALRVTADDDVDTRPVLDLAPVRRALAGLVGGAEPLRHHALEALRRGGGEQCFSLADTVGRHHPVVAGVDEVEQQPPAVLVRQTDRVVAVDREHVEDVERRLASRGAG